MQIELHIDLFGQHIGRVASRLVQDPDFSVHGVPGNKGLFSWQLMSPYSTRMCCGVPVVDDPAVTVPSGLVSFQLRMPVILGVSHRDIFKSSWLCYRNIFSDNYCWYSE